MSDAVSFAWLCAVFAAGGYATQQLGGRLWVAAAIGAVLALALVSEGAYLELFARGRGPVTANAAAGVALYVGAAVLGWFLARRRDRRPHGGA